MVSKIVIVAVCLVVAVTAIPPGASVFGPPAWLANMPWIPKWSACDGTIPGASCSDCATRIICTKLGRGLTKSCSDPALPYCNLGECSATPSAECAAPVPANAA